MDEGLGEAIALAAPDATRPLAIEVLIRMARQCQGFARQARAEPMPDPAAAPWGWRCGFYPGSEPGECTSGTAATFDQARGDFEAA